MDKQLTDKLQACYISLSDSNITLKSHNLIKLDDDFVTFHEMPLFSRLLFIVLCHMNVSLLDNNWKKGQSKQKMKFQILMCL